MTYRDDPIAQQAARIDNLEQRIDELTATVAKTKRADVKVALFGFLRRAALTLGVLALVVMVAWAISHGARSCSENSAREWKQGRHRCDRVCRTMDMSVFSYSYDHGVESCTCLGNEGQMGRFNSGYDEFTWILHSSPRTP